MQDSQIIALYDARDERAIAETADKYGGFCKRIALNILQNLQDAEECVNDTWRRTWETIPPEAPSVLATYLGMLTRCIALDRAKKNRAIKRGGGTLPLITKAADYDRSDPLFALDARATDIRALALGEKAGQDMTRPPVIVD